MATYDFKDGKQSVFVPESKLENMTLAFRKELQPFLVARKVEVFEPVRKGLIDLRKSAPVRTEKEAWEIVETTFKKHAPALQRISKRQWHIRWANACMTRCAGNCRFFRGEIRIAKPFAMKVPKEVLIDVVLHEIAHGFARWTNLDTPPHGELWQRKAREIGCSAKATHNYMF
jgi:hypothetical protein